jgi:hypothetical protein
MGIMQTIETNPGLEQPGPEASGEANSSENHEISQGRSDVVATMATVGVVGIGAAAFEAALLPGIVLGVAAVWLSKFSPKVGEKLYPLLRSTVRGAYRLGQKTKEVIAEAQEQVHDVVAEVDAEHDAKRLRLKNPADGDETEFQKPAPGA